MTFNRKEYDKKYRQENRVRRKIVNDKWLVSHHGWQKIQNTLKKDRDPFYWNTPHYRFCHYRSRAKRKRMQFTLTEEQFNLLLLADCYYCGERIYTMGIDRVDSEKGYIIENCVSACTHCNIGKHELSVQDFITLCKKVARRFPD